MEAGRELYRPVVAIVTIGIAVGELELAVATFVPSGAVRVLVRLCARATPRRDPKVPTARRSVQIGVVPGTAWARAAATSMRAQQRGTGAQSNADRTDVLTALRDCGDRRALAREA